MSGFISMDDIEKLVTFNSELVPIIKFVKVWTQPTGAWGVTLKLMKLRVKKQASKKARNDADFLDSDEESDSVPQAAAKPAVSAAKPAVSAAKPAVSVAADSSDEEESDAESESDEKPAVVAKPATKKAVVAVESSSDEESDEEPVKPAKPAAKGKTATTASKSKKASA
jgi:hypothetical protein